jgi:ribosomal protein S18 acetylase RimI-like enzyme
MDFVIRQIASDDRRAWKDLYKSYLEFYESEPIASSTELLWERLVSSPAIIQSFVAQLNGELVGIVHFQYQLSTWTHTYHCYLEDLYVAKEHRGNGIARALIEAVRASALEEKCSELFWITKESNKTAQKLYDKLATKSDFIRYEIMLED